MRVVFTRRARDDVRAIGDYIARESPSRAERFARELIWASRSIADAPHGMPLLSGREAVGLRRKPYRGYLIFYVASASQIEIVRIIHGARDIDRLLSSDGDQ